MKNKKIIKCGLLIAVMILGITFLGLKKEHEILKSERSKRKPTNETISMMYETEAGSGEYQTVTDSKWKTEGYVFNENLSKCEQGSKIFWDKEKKEVIIKADKSDKCYVYFDEYAYHSTCNDNTIACRVAKTYGSDATLLWHNAKLINGANDKNYRYSGNEDVIKNYVCLDSNVTPCPADNLYRIIGVLDEQIKLIKNEPFTILDEETNESYYETYRWGTTNEWSESKLNTKELNNTYLNNTLSNGLQGKISEVNWHTYMSNSSAEQTFKAKDFYEAEMSCKTTYKAKIALMYAHDFGFAASTSEWGKTLFYNTLPKSWIILDEPEWLIDVSESQVIGSTTYYYAYSTYLSNRNILSIENVTYYYTVRPVFYLNHDVEYASGEGTQSNPYRILIDN